MKYKFFWNGPFSNWHLANFEYLGIVFNCAEQAMMYMKAKSFGDEEIANRILNCKYPKEHKELGRRVRNFDYEKWCEVRFEIVKNILRCKFVQSQELKSELLKYKGYEFVEASPFDRIWGIGYSETDALDHIDDWGENLLGKILTELSAELK